jgi:hypothetical protein
VNVTSYLHAILQLCIRETLRPFLLYTFIHVSQLVKVTLQSIISSPSHVLPKNMKVWCLMLSPALGYDSVSIGLTKHKTDVI